MAGGARARGCEGGIVVYGIQRMKLVESCKVGLFHNQLLIFNAFSVASVRKSIRSWFFETFLA